MSVVRAHQQGLSSSMKAEIFGVVDVGCERAVLDLFPQAHLFPRSWPSRWFRGGGLSRALVDAASSVDLFHVHMLWDHTVYATWKASKATGRPFVITPHGSLVPFPMRSSGIDKKVYQYLMLDRVLSDASCVHVLNDVEKQCCQEYGIKCPIKVIPNGLPSQQFDQKYSPELALSAWPVLNNRRVMLYMGRLWSGKGLDVLPAALAKIDFAHRFPDWILVLAGPDYRGYEAILAKQINKLGLSESVVFTGYVEGDLKFSLLAACDFFVLPSHAEGFSMALLEAVACAKPSLISPECNMPELCSAGGAWVAQADSDSLAEILNYLLDENMEFFDAAGKRAWCFGRDKYTLEIVLESLVTLYNEVI